MQFKPSSEDMRDEPHHRLSVFAEDLTPDEHVYRLTNTTAEEAILPRLEVDHIRAIRPDPIAPDIPVLEVEWHHKYDIDKSGVKHRDTSPGADGHSGIRDLTKGDKKQRKSLRVQLASIAQADYEKRRQLRNPQQMNG